MAGSERIGRTPQHHQPQTAGHRLVGEFSPRLELSVRVLGKNL